MCGGTAHRKGRLYAMGVVRAHTKALWLKAAACGAGTALAIAASISGLNANSERTISLYNIHTKDTLTVTYKRNGRFVPEALEKLNWHLRDWRRNEPTKIDPGLVDLLWEIHEELGSRMPVHVISAYRSPATNALLRKTRGGQAKLSQHMLGKAIDVRFPDIPVRRLRYSALLREQGGVGYYPTSATPFVHIDTGRVRHWPRMGREELALLFPSGRTQHRPSSGGPVTQQDAVAARNDNPSLAQRVAAFHVNRRAGPDDPQASVQVAMARQPELIGRPKLVFSPPGGAGVGAGNDTDRGAARGNGWVASYRPTPRPLARAAPDAMPPLPFQSDPEPLPFRPALRAASEPARGQVAGISVADRSGLKQLASLAFDGPSRSSSASLGSASNSINLPRNEDWATAPAYDEEHPEELFYLPFPIGPYITETASIDDPALQEMTHPDVEKTLTLLVADGLEDPPLQIRPGLQVANLMWSQSFEGNSRGARPSRPELARADAGLGFAGLAQNSTWGQVANTWLGRRLVQLAGR